MLDRYGRHWGASSMRKMALDTALAAPPDTGTGKRKWGPGDWAKNHTRHALGDALEAACTEHGLSDDEHQALRDLVEQHLHGEAQSGGAAATDKGAGARDADDEIDAKVRELLKGHGPDDESVERAIAMARKDREAARDSRPENAIHGGFGGRLSGVSKEESPESMEVQYPGIGNVLGDNYGEQPEPPRLSGRPMYAGDAAFDEDIEEVLAREYGSSGPKIGMFGR
jgi:hypothetical protein